MKADVGGKVQYAFRRPRFPILYAVERELFCAASASVFQRQIARLAIREVQPLDLIDASGEGWAFHPDLTIVSPLTLKKRWKKIEVIRLFNQSDNAGRLGGTYPERYVGQRSLGRIIAEVSALVAYAKPNMPRHRT